MDTREKTITHQVLRCKSRNCDPKAIELIGEEPLLIRIDDKPYSVVMRTPGDELFHAAGFCLGEGIADSADDFATIGHCEDMDPNVVEIRLKPERRDKIGDVLNRRGFVSQTSCGICGKELVEDLYQILTPAENGLQITFEQAFDCIDKLNQHQQFYEVTRGSHAAIILNRQLEVLSFAEDVGRHNALDKAIGKTFMHRTLPQAAIAVLSSRISYELVQKGARARIPMMISHSRPTALAAQMGQSLNMTLAFPSEETELTIVSGAQRVIGDQRGEDN